MIFDTSRKYMHFQIRVNLKMKSQIKSGVKTYLCWKGGMRVAFNFNGCNNRIEYNRKYIFPDIK